jgi:hypothetical protein
LNALRTSVRASAIRRTGPAGQIQRHRQVAPLQADDEPAVDPGRDLASGEQRLARRREKRAVLDLDRQREDVGLRGVQQHALGPSLADLLAVDDQRVFRLRDLQRKGERVADLDLRLGLAREERHLGETDVLELQELGAGLLVGLDLDLLPRARAGPLARRRASDVAAQPVRERFGPEAIGPVGRDVGVAHGHRERPPAPRVGDRAGHRHLRGRVVEGDRPTERALSEVGLGARERGVHLLLALDAQGERERRRRLCGHEKHGGEDAHRAHIRNTPNSVSGIGAL